MTTAQILAWVVTLIAALGGGAFFREVAAGIFKAVTGKQTKERQAIRVAWAERDEEATKRRILAEYASQVRRVAIDAGIKPEQLPPFPDL